MYILFFIYYMSTLYYGDLFDTNSSIINIHDLNKFNNIRKNRISFNSLNQQLKLLGNVDPNNRTDYVENGITITEELYIKELLKNNQNKQEFIYPTNDFIFLQNLDQNTFKLDLILDGSSLTGQFPRINYIEFEVNNFSISEIISINPLFSNWDISFINDKIIIQNLNDDFIPSSEEFVLFTIQYLEPNDNWNRQVNLKNLKVRSYIIDHIVLNNKILYIPLITGGDSYSLEALNYLSSKNYINDSIRIKPVNHSQQDNMFIIFSLENVIPSPGDIVFVVDDHLFGFIDQDRIRNYLCGWYEITDTNLNNTKYIAVYIDYNSEYGNSVSNVDYKYKYYSSVDDKIYDLETIDGNKYKSLGYGSLSNPLVLTKSNVSVIFNEINNENIYNLLTNYF